MKQETQLGSAAWGFRELPLEEQLALAKELELQTHELGIANAPGDLPLDASDGELERVRNLYRAYGLSLVCAATGNDLTGQNVPEQVEKLKRVLEMCQKLEISMVRIFTGFTPLSQMAPPNWENQEKALDILAPEARQRGVTLCLETHGGVEPWLDGVRHIPSSSTEAAALLALAEPRGIRLVFDPANLRVVGQNIEQFFEAVQHQIGYIHLKDFRRGSGGQLYPCALGEGDTQWGGLLSRMGELGVPILFEYELPQDLYRGMETSVNFWKEQVL